MHAYLLEMLQCPACHGTLNWHVSEQDGDRIQTAEARCRACVTAYPVEEGIALFLTPDLPRRDLWEESESRLFPGARPDAFPVAPTTLEWVVLNAH